MFQFLDALEARGVECSVRPLAGRRYLELGASGTTPPLTTTTISAFFAVAVDADATNQNYLVINSGGRITITNRQFGVLGTSTVGGTPRGGCFGL